MGVLVKTEILVQNQNTIDISDLNNGIFIFEVKIDKSLISKQKLIIQR